MDTLQSDYQRFLHEGGGDIKNKAKLYNNVIREALLKIPITQVCRQDLLFCVQILKASTFTQVCIPDLHMSLGIFSRLYELLEEECHSLDLQLAHSTSSDNSESSFAKYSAALTELCRREKELQSHKQHTEAVEQIITYLALALPDAESNPQLDQAREGAAAGRVQIQEMVRHLTCTACENLTHLQL